VSEMGQRKMNKLVFISNMAAPYQVKFCYALQNYFNAEFWFHVYLEPDRPDWWKIELGEKCKILGNVVFKGSRRYLSLDIIKELNRFDPDIVVLGGFALASYIVSYYWSKLHRKKVVMFTEVSRNRRGVVRRSGSFTRFVKFLYKDIDAILTSAIEGTEQFRDVFGFGDRVCTAQYPSDIDEHVKHPLRKEKDAYVYLYANRLTPIYNPILAIEIFNVVQKRYPGSTMLMNASGELFDECRSRIRELGLTSKIEFLEQITSWNDLHEVYRASDILILPAVFSAGNFTVIEAMASGMGIVVSNKVLGSGVDHIENGKNGFICDPNVDDFVKAIDIYNENPILLRTHATANREIVKKYSTAQTAVLWHELLSSIALEQ